MVKSQTKIVYALVRGRKKIYVTRLQNCKRKALVLEDGANIEILAWFSDDKKAQKYERLLKQCYRDLKKWRAKYGVEG